MQEEALLMDLIVKPDVIPHFVSYAFLSSAILIGVALSIRGSLSLVPRGLQNFVEVMVESLLNLSEENIGHHWGGYFFPLIATMGLYILLGNFMGLIPGFTAPTSNINCTASMAVPVFLATHYYGIRVHGIKYIKHFLGPVMWLAPMMFVIEVIGHLVRPVTLSVRLFGNMIAKHMILFALAMIAPIVIPSLILGLGVLVSLIQAFVFVLLSALYLAGAVEEAH
jgi:F-type H+-transporting ATPase subunit a